MVDVLNPKCAARISAIDSSCGCTLTRADVYGLTPEMLAGFDMTELNMASVIAKAQEAKILGVSERGLPALLRGSLKNIKGDLQRVKVEEQSIILPFIQRKQRSTINANYFIIETGIPSATAGVGAEPDSTFQFTVNLGYSDWKSPLTGIQRYFLPGMVLYVQTTDANGNIRRLHYTVYAAANANAGGVEKANVKAYPNLTDTAWALLNSGEKAVYQPIYGLVEIGPNNVSDRESWCNNQPQDLAMQLKEFWLQTSRESFCVSDSYKEMLNLILSGKVNDYAKIFKYQSLADQQKRARQLSDDEWLRGAFWNQAIDENQTTALYRNLPTVVDPLTAEAGENCVQEYKANALGYYELINRCNRCVDFGGAALDLDQIFEDVYILKRNRESDGDSIQVIDCMTDRLTANRILEAMSKYYKAKYGVDTTRYYQPNQALTFDKQVLFNYNLYQIPEAGCELAVFHDPFFDDRIAATPADVLNTPAGFKSSSRMMWFIDWSDFRIGLGATNSVTRKYPDPASDALYKCIMLPNITERVLRSMQWTVMVEREQRHKIYQNFSDECPLLSANSCAPSDRSDSGSGSGASSSGDQRAI